MKKERTGGSHAVRRVREKPKKTRAARNKPAPPRWLSSKALSGMDRRKKHILFAALTAVFAVLIIVLALFLIGSADSREYKEYMSQAQESYQAGDYDNALNYLRKAANINSSDECLMLMVDCYVSQQNYEKAIEVLRKMDTGKDSVMERIEQVEQLRSQFLAMSKIDIAGKLFSPDATGIVLDGLDISDETLSQISQFRSLDNLSLMNNSLQDISALSGLGGLATLNLSGNKISDISPLESLTGLRTLYLDNNPITDFSPLFQLKNLSTLSIRGISISPRQMEELSAALPSCAIHSDAASEDLVEITLGGISFKSDVEELDLSDRGIRDISSLSICKNLVKLDLSGNAISDLCPLMNIPGLEWLDISDNQLLDLKPLIGLGTLRTIDASGNSISSTTSIGAMTALTELDLSENSISDYSGLKKLRNLQTLGLNNTGINDDGLEYLAYLSSLSRLYLENNEQLSGEAVDELKAALGSCEIIHSPLVYSVEVGGVSVREDATEINISGRGISDISGMVNLKYLETLDFSKNNISNIYIFQYSSSANTITSLDLSGNVIEDITAIASLPNLVTLNLANNKVNSVQPLMGLEDLRSLDLRGNKLTDKQLEELRAVLTNCEILS